MNKLFELYKKEKEVKYQIKQERHYLHNEFFKLNKSTFLFLDILFILGILFNLGAVTMTNLKMNVQIQEKAELLGIEDQIEYVEMNPVIAKQHKGIPAAPKEEMVSFWKMVGFAMAGWIVWIYAYLFYRRNTYTHNTLTLLMIGVVFFVIMTGMNFFSDLGWFL